MIVANVCILIDTHKLFIVSAAPALFAGFTPYVLEFPSFGDVAIADKVGKLASEDLIFNFFADREECLGNVGVFLGADFKILYSELGA